MVFYEFEGFIADEKWAEENENRRVLREKCRSIAMKSKAYNRKLQRQGFFYVSTASDDTVSIGIICRQPQFVEEHLSEYVDAVGLELKDTCLEETTFNTARNMLQCSCRNDFIDDDDDILEQFNLDKLAHRFGRSVDYCEFIVKAR